MNQPSKSIPVYLFVLPWSLQHLGGVNQVVINLARQMTVQRTFDPVVLVTDWNAKDPVWETIHGVRTVRWRVRAPGPGRDLKQKIANFLWQRRFGPAFREFCRTHNVAAINPHYPTEPALTLAHWARTCVPALQTIVSFHGADVAGMQACNPHSLRVWRRMLAQCKGIVACSSALSSIVQETFGRAPSVIHNGIDAAAFGRMAGPPMLAARRFILSVGKFEAKKGQEILIRAFSTLADTYPDLDLVLVGATDRMLQPLEQLCLELGIESRVRFRPDLPHDAVARCFASATIFALPSRQEPFGIVLLEAGCLALPVVASAVGGVPEILEDGITARLVPPDRPGELSLALRQLLDDPAAAKAMGDRLRTHVLRKFSWARAHASYVALARDDSVATKDDCSV